MSTKILAGRYDLYNKIGEGGMSVVYKAHDRILNRNIAIKILKPEFVTDSKFTDSFRREAQAAAGLSHPNIVNVYDVGKEGNIHYIVMELVEGQVLSDIIKEEGALPYNRTLEISKQIASALSFAHHNNIIHRDVKPHNVLITSSGIAKITDFGIAKAINASTIVDGSNTGEGVIGSVHYFSPEQARGGYVDEKSDIYSLGIVMYEMLTGKVPFDADNPVSVALMHINNDIIPLSQVVPSIPPGVEQIVMKATRKDPKLRFSNADEMIEAIDNVEFVSRVVGTPSYSRQNTNIYHVPDDNEIEEYEEDGTGKKKKKKKIMLIGIAAAVVLIILGILFATGFFGSEKTVPDLVGMTYSEAKDAAESDGFKIKKGEEVYDNEVEKGEVSTQSPNEGIKAKKGSTIIVDICIGHKNSIVPDLKGLTRKGAKDALEAADFKLGTVEREESTADKGTVISQDPDPGATEEAGTEVNIVISKGVEKVTVPNLADMTYDEAQQALTDAGLVMGNLSYDYSDKYGKNKVMLQQYAAGSSIPKGTAVSIRISKGPKQREGTASIYISYSKAQSDVFALTVTVSDADGTRNVISGKQRSKADGGETVNIKGKGKGTVIVLCDSEEVMRKNVTFK